MTQPSQNPRGRLVGSLPDPDDVDAAPTAPAAAADAHLSYQLKGLLVTALLLLPGGLVEPLVEYLFPDTGKEQKEQKAQQKAQKKAQQLQTAADKVESGQKLLAPDLDVLCAALEIKPPPKGVEDKRLAVEARLEEEQEKDPAWTAARLKLPPSRITRPSWTVEPATPLAARPLVQAHSRTAWRGNAEVREAALQTDFRHLADAEKLEGGLAKELGRFAAKAKTGGDEDLRAQIEFVEDKAVDGARARYSPGGLLRMYDRPEHHVQVHERLGSLVGDVAVTALITLVVFALAWDALLKVDAHHRVYGGLSYICRLAALIAVAPAHLVAVRLARTPASLPTRSLWFLPLLCSGAPHPSP